MMEILWGAKSFDNLIRFGMTLALLCMMLPLRRPKRQVVAILAASILLFFIGNSLLLLFISVGENANLKLVFYLYILLHLLVGSIACRLCLQGQTSQIVVTIFFFISVHIISGTLANTSNLVSYLISYLIVGLVMVIYRRISTPIDIPISNVYWAVAMLTPALILILHDIWQAAYSVISGWYFYAMGITLLLLDIFVYFLFIRLAGEFSRQMDLQLANQNMMFQMRQMEDMEIQLENTRKARHEMKNNYFLLQSLLEEGRYDALRIALNEVIQFQFAQEDMVSTGNRFVDMLLSQKVEEARQKNIPIALDTLLPSEIAINQRMLCSILFNLLDNAIEASERIPNPSIFLSMRKDKGSLFIEVQNQIETSVLENNPELKTSKKDRGSHGIGLGVVRQIVTRCDGYMRVWEENGKFIVSLMISDEMSD